MQVCGVSLKNPPLIFSTVGGIAGYFITHNFNRTFSGIVSSVALETIWGLASEPKHPKFENAEQRITYVRAFKALGILLPWAYTYGYYNNSSSAPFREIQYSHSFFRCCSLFLFPLANFFCVKFSLTNCESVLMFDRDLEFSKAWLVTDCLATAGSIVGVWMGVKTNTSIPVGAAIGYTLGVITEKVSNCVKRRLASNRRMSPAHRAVA